jgi:hypothetical protein
MNTRVHDAGAPEAELVTGRRPDTALALVVPLWVETALARPNREGEVSGYAIALGWNTPQDSTAYLVSDDALPRPVWIGEAELVSNSVRRPS